MKLVLEGLSHLGESGKLYQGTVTIEEVGKPGLFTIRVLAKNSEQASRILKEHVNAEMPSATIKQVTVNLEMVLVD